MGEKVVIKYLCLAKLIIDSLNPKCIQMLAFLEDELQDNSSMWHDPVANEFCLSRSINIRVVTNVITKIVFWHL